MKSKKVSEYIFITLLLFAGMGLVAGLYEGIGRMGVAWDGHQTISPLLHGPLMINGFLAALIGLERAAALEKGWAYLAPACLTLSTVCMLLGINSAGTGLLVAGTIFLLSIMIFLYRLQPEAYHLIMILGAACLLTGNPLLSAGYPIFELVTWWAGFLLLTIFAERLELNRVMRPPQHARDLFLALVLLWIIGITLMYWDRYVGWIVASVVLIVTACWLFRYDVARRTIKVSGWTRYSAICLLMGYGWLIVAGLFGLAHGLPFAGLPYDAQLHMIFAGFVFSMIFAHASVIIPSLSGRRISYHSYFYFPLVLLHGFLLVRIIGDIAGMPKVRIIGGHGNAGAILLFLGGILFQLVRESVHKNKQAAQL